MAIVITKIADVIQPDLWNQYTLDRTTEKSPFVSSGIMVSNPMLDQIITGGGTTLHMPKWNDLDGDDEVMSDQRDISVDKITSKAEIATFLYRAKAWGTHDLAGALAGSDPMNAIVELASNWWVRKEQQTLLSVLKGIFASASMADLVQGDLTAPQPLDGLFVLDAKQRLGDMADQLTAFIMHSAVYTDLQKQNLIQYTTQSDGKVVIPTFLTYRVIIDDTLPTQDVNGKKVFTSYLFANGTIARAQAAPVAEVPVEVDRNSLGSTDILIHRKAMVIHPLGISWVGSGKTVDSTPTNAELATGTNWERVSDIKKIGIVQMLHTLKG